MPSAYRDGRAEMRRANQILERQLPVRLRKRLIPLPSPGRASLVNIRYEGGYRGTDLDYEALDEDWEILAEGSSSFPGEGFVIHADGQSSQVYLGTFLPKLYREWGERPGTPSWPHEQCILIDTHQERVAYFDEHVSLEPQQYQLLLALVELSGDKGRDVANYKLLRHFDVSENADLSELISRIRAAFRKAARELREELAEAAVSLVDELLPRKRPGMGYRIGRYDLYNVT